jgi:hypothetical protein
MTFILCGIFETAFFLSTFPKCVIVDDYGGIPETPNNTFVFGFLFIVIRVQYFGIQRQ